MTSENELKVGDVLSKLNHLIFCHDRNHGETNEGSEICNNAINLIKSQKSRIEILESAIREFNAADKATDHAEDGCALGDINIDYFERKWKAEETLRNLMENEK